MSPISFNTLYAGLRSRGMSTSTSSQSKVTTALKNAITYQNVNAMQEELSRTVLLHETWQAVLTYAFEQRSSDTIMSVLLQHSTCPAQYALKLAVQHNNIDGATQALLRGADPEHLDARPNTVPMHKLLADIRRKNTLYPPHTPHDQGTDLDRALRKLPAPAAKQEAHQLLNQALSGGTAEQAWRDAVKEDRRDIQRAILLLHADTNRGFCILQENPVMDEGVAKVMKEIPYLSPKRRPLENFNGKTKFRGKDKTIDCAHLAEHRQAVLEQSDQLKFKFDDAQYSSLENIATHVSYATEAKIHRLCAHATKTHLFHNRDFGKTLVQQFDEMMRKQETTRLILLISTDHAMSVELKIKEKDGKPPHYVARLFDPNYTTSHVRVASDNLHTLEGKTLKNFIAEEDSYKWYYPGSEALSMMMVRLSPQEEQAMANRGAGAVENRTLTSSIGDKKINATALFYMLAHGFAGDLRRLTNEITNRPKEEQVRLLTAKESHGTPGLYAALLNGHADAIKAFGELLEQLQLKPEECTELLAAKDDRGIPGLYMALQNGHADAIKAFGELLKYVPPEELVALLTAKNSRGIPGLYMALKNSHADAIKAFGELLKHVPPEELAALLTAKNDRVIPGLHMALQNGRADAIKAFGELLKHVPPEELVALLTAKDDRGIHGLHMALQNGHADAIKAFGELLKHVPPAEQIRLLAAKFEGNSGISIALQNGRHEAIKAFGELLDNLLTHVPQHVPSMELVELLTIKNSDGTSGLAIALKATLSDDGVNDNQLEAVAQYVEIVKKVAPVLSAQERAALLEYIRESHARHKPGGRWVNQDYYENLKIWDPAFYSQFKEMKKALKNPLHKSFLTITSSIQGGFQRIRNTFEKGSY